MKVCFLMTFFILAKSFFCLKDLDITPCNKDDVECFANLVKQLMKFSVEGIPKYKIEPLDPLIISYKKYDTLKTVIFHLSSLNITGLKDIDILDTKLNLKEKTLEIKMKLDLIITANMSIEFIGIHKSIANIRFWTKTNPIIMTTEYGFEMSPNAERVNYFSVKNETTNCQITGAPVVKLDADLDSVLRGDIELQEELIQLNKKKSRAWRDKIICMIAEKAVSKAIDNFRTVSSFMPATEYIMDIEKQNTRHNSISK